MIRFIFIAMLLLAAPAWALDEYERGQGLIRGFA